MKKDNPDFIGELLNDYWNLKKQLDKKVTNKKINNIYNLCIKNGATGGKLLGAGNGGFMLFYVPIKNHTKFKKNLEVK